MKKLFTKKGNVPKKLKSRLVLKHGTYNAVLIAIVLVALVVINVLATVVAERFPTHIDLTASGENTISEENAEYLRGVDKDVNIVVCATEEGYLGGMMQTYAYNYYKTQDTTGGYYEQTVRLLDMYDKYNKHIKLSYSDPDATSFATVQKIVPETTLTYGDILVYSTFEKDGQEITNSKVLSFGDIYDLYDESGYAAQGYGLYTVTGSKVETAVTSAIYTVTSEEAKTVAMLSGHNRSEITDQFEADLELNGFDVLDIPDSIVTKIPEEVDVVVIASPTTDLAAEEIAVLEAFLENGGEKGKNLVVFGDAASIDMPNLYDFMKEWGISYQPNSILFETDDSNSLAGLPGTMGFINQETDYTTAVNSSKKIYLASNNVPMTAAYSTYGNRTVTALLTTQNTVVAAPIDATSEWEPTDDYEKQVFGAAMITADTDYNDAGEEMSSHVLAFSSVNLVAEEWTSYDAVGNTAYVISVIKKICGVDNSEISFVSKIVSTYSFTAPTEASVAVMKVVFMGLVPVALIAVGIVVWVRRKNR